MSWYMQVVTSLGRKIGKAFGEREVALYVVGAICTEINAFDAICCKIYMKTFIPVIRAAIIFGRHGSRSRIPVSCNNGFTSFSFPPVVSPIRPCAGLMTVRVSGRRKYCQYGYNGELSREMRMSTPFWIRAGIDGAKTFTRDMLEGDDARRYGAERIDGEIS